MNAITIKDLGKAYVQYPHRWARLLEWLDPAGRSRHLSHWVLKDLNLQIKSGQAIAIIGMNGAGKSTLLKLIAKTLYPTVGSIQVLGKVAALLELGMGFHPDFTGRENVKMAAQLLGITNEELVHLMPDIEAFADIGEFIDQPFRIYSSGMQVRLAFSVATAIRPDILIVDEALAVGDSAFQQKCFSRIQSFCDQGTTLLLVSHDQSMISNLCDYVILLEKGKILKEGEPGPIFDFYNELVANRNAQAQELEQETKKTSTAKGIHLPQLDDSAHSVGVKLCAASDTTPIKTVSVGQSVSLCLTTPLGLPGNHLIVAFELKNRFGQVVYSTHTNAIQFSDSTSRDQELTSPKQDKEWYFNFDMNVSKGQYSIAVAAVNQLEKLQHRAHWQELAICFEVVNLGLPHFEN